MLNAGDVIAGKFRIINHLNRGMMANAYEAELLASKRKVFFKEYISPRPTVSWYKGFVAYQKAMGKTLRGSDVANFCLLAEETFEEDSRVTAAGEKRRTPKVLYQTFEFISNGQDLEKRLKTVLPWEQRLVFARVFMAGLSLLHKVGVVHCDLKPANLQLIEDPTIGARFRLKLIDMDFSVLSAKKAPWDGHNGYVGSPGYMSPEHLGASGQAPGESSDVFTAAIILHELLGGGHPLHGFDDEEIMKRVKAGRIDRMKLRGSLGKSDHDARVVEVVHACFHADPRKRPKAAELQAAVLATAPSGTPPALPGRGTPPPPPLEPVPPASSLHPAALRLTANGQSIEVRVTTRIGKGLLQRFGADAQFAAVDQYQIIRDPSGAWFVEHVASSGNETIHNGNKLISRAALKPGDRIAVGNSTKKIEKVSVTVGAIA